MAQNPRKIDSLTPEALRELEGDWRAGLLSIRVIAAKYRVAPEHLSAYARKVGWDKGDLGVAINKAATSALVQRAVGDTLPADGLAPDTRETVRQYGQIVAQVIESQRSDVGSARNYCTKLRRELEELTGPEIDEAAVNTLADLIADQNPELAKMLRPGKKSLLPLKEQLMFLALKADILKTLAIATEKFITLERQAWGLDRPGGGATAGYDEFLDEIHGEQDQKLPKRVN